MSYKFRFWFHLFAFVKSETYNFILIIQEINFKSSEIQFTLLNNAVKHLVSCEEQNYTKFGNAFFVIINILFLLTSICLTISWKKIEASSSLNNLEPVSLSNCRHNPEFNFYFKTTELKVSKKIHFQYFVQSYIF